MPRSRTLVLPLLALLLGCHHPGLSEGDRLARAGKTAEATRAYETVLADGDAEKWDKEAASTAWREAWSRRHAEEREAVRGKVAELERSTLAPAEVRMRVLALRKELDAFGETSRELATLSRILERAVEKEWAEVDALARGGRFVAADELASAILAVPGLPASFATRAKAMREAGARAYQEKAASAREQAPLASALYRALAEHLLARPITPAKELAADALPRVRIEPAPRAGCEVPASKLPAVVAPVEGDAKLVLRMDVACSSTALDETVTKQATYYVTEPAGTMLETYYETEQVCTSSPFCPPAVVTMSGGQQYVVNQCRDVVTCTPTAVARTREVPAFKETPRVEPYPHVFRTYRAELRGTLGARLEGTDEQTVAVDLSATEKDERYDRANGRQTTRDRRAFDPKLSTATVLAKLDADLFVLAKKVAKQAFAVRGEAILRAAPTEGLPRTEAVFRASLFGAPRAEAQTKESDGLDRERMLALLTGRDPLPRNDASPPGPTSQPASRDAAPTPSSRGGYPGYERTMQLQLLFGSLATADVPASATNGTAAQPGESAFVGAVRFETPVLGDGAPSGFQFLDAASARFAFGSRTSDDVLGPEHSGTAFRLDADYTAMLGVRVRQLGVFAGARGRGLFVSTGEITAPGFQVPLCARLEARLVSNFMPTATACAFSLAGGEHTSLDAFVPLSRAGGFHAFAHVERITADADLGGYRFGFSDAEPLGFRSVLFGLGLGK